MSLAPTVTVEQAAFNALGAWLAGRMDGVTVSYVWPDPERALGAKVISILRAGQREDELTDPAKCGEEQIHDLAPAVLTLADPTDLASSVSVTNTLVLSYEAHRVDLDAHQAADTVHAVTAPVATDLPTSITRAEQLRAKLNPHELDVVPHATADTKNAVTAPTVPTATTLPTLIVLLKALIRALGRHYAARIDVWRVASCRLPVQLDVWATYEAVRDLLLAQLEPLLHADPYESAGVGGYAGREPVRAGVLVQLGDGWSGTADFDFTEPRLLQTASSQQASEFRAIYTGLCDFALMVKAQSARMASITLQQALDGSSAIRTTTVTADETIDTEA